MNGTKRTRRGLRTRRGEQIRLEALEERTLLSTTNSYLASSILATYPSLTPASFPEHSPSAPTAGKTGTAAAHAGSSADPPAGSAATANSLFAQPGAILESI